jgi:hypothetical protein
MDSFDKARPRKYAPAMTAVAADILEQFRKLSPAERVEVCELVLRESTQVGPRPGRKTLADIAGKYRPQPDASATAHDRGFAEAILNSKGHSGPP